MANTQINISSNGTKTLATAGKYCDRNIDVNVNVPIPSGYIKPSGSKTITENGTHDVTQYANAVVNVPGKATQFTNLYDPANVTLQTVANADSSGVTYATDKQVNCIKVPYNHAANAPVVMRIRGIGTVRDRFNCVLLNENQERIQHYQISNGSYFTHGYDEHGDIMITFKSGPQGYAWKYFLFNFQYFGINSGATEAKTGPIITINEPIGNGGYAE